MAKMHISTTFDISIANNVYAAAVGILHKLSLDNTVGRLRHEKNRKPPNIVCGHLYLNFVWAKQRIHCGCSMDK